MATSIAVAINPNIPQIHQPPYQAKMKKNIKKVAWVLPMSTKPKNGIHYHNLEHEGKVFTVILSQCVAK